MYKKIVAFISTLALLLVMSVNTTNTVYAAEQSNSSESGVVNINQRMYIPLGGSQIIQFNLGTDDTISLEFENISGKYKYIVIHDIPSGGFNPEESPELSTDYCFGYLFLGGLGSMDSMKVLIINTGYTTLTGSISIKSAYSGS